ncbi:MAG: hypothetical protein LBI03_05715, partial [Clostridiales bacterium]|nr:hypothetical protein [Clostridiales bacterium]
KDEKEQLVRSVRPAVDKSKLEMLRAAERYGIKQINLDSDWSVEQTVNIVAEYFGLTLSYTSKI